MNVSLTDSPTLPAVQSVVFTFDAKSDPNILSGCTQSILRPTQEIWAYILE